jgi:hypothetical protein
MRVLMAGIIGGIVMFVWGALAHTLLGLGMVGIHQPINEDAVINGLRPGLGQQAGIYILPSFDPARMSDKAASQAYTQKIQNAPYAFVVYMPQAEDMTQMGPQLGRQWASDTLAALALAFVMGLAAFSFGKRIGIAVAAAIFSWLCTMVPYWNWYRFPLNFTLAALAEQVIGWILAGAVMAWWLGRRVR